MEIQAAGSESVWAVRLLWGGGQEKVEGELPTSWGPLPHPASIETTGTDPPSPTPRSSGQVTLTAIMKSAAWGPSGGAGGAVSIYKKGGEKNQSAFLKPFTNHHKLLFEWNFLAPHQSARRFWLKSISSKFVSRTLAQQALSTPPGASWSQSRWLYLLSPHDRDRRARVGVEALPWEMLGVLAVDLEGGGQNWRDTQERLTLSLPYVHGFPSCYSCCIFLRESHGPASFIPVSWYLLSIQMLSEPTSAGTKQMCHLWATLAQTLPGWRTSFQSLYPGLQELKGTSISATSWGFFFFPTEKSSGPTRLARSYRDDNTGSPFASVWHQLLDQLSSSLRFTEGASLGAQPHSHQEPEENTRCGSH